MMRIGNMRADGYVDRWTLVVAPVEYDEAGEPAPDRWEPRCVEDAVPIGHPLAALAAARNAAIAEALAGQGDLTPEAVEARAQVLLPGVRLPAPVTISDRQFAQALAALRPELISQPEALAWAGRGDIPAALLALLDDLPADAAFAARMKLAAAVEYRRDDPLVDLLAGRMGVTPAEVDDIWRLAASL